MSNFLDFISLQFINSFTVFVLACFVGYYVVTKVSPALHTPLVSITNAISGIILVGAIVVTCWKFGSVQADILGFVSIFLSAVNIFGGIAVTYRMIKMFQQKK